MPITPSEREDVLVLASETKSSTEASSKLPSWEFCFERLPEIRLSTSESE